VAQSLKESYDGLELEVEKKTAALTQALKEVERLNSLKSQFVSSVSHELRTPLTSIKGYGDTLVRLQEKISAFNAWNVHKRSVLKVLGSRASSITCSTYRKLNPA